MNVHDEVELSRVLARTNIQLYIAPRTRFLNKGVGSVRTSTIYPVCEEGMALVPERGTMGECGLQEKESPPRLHVVMGVGVKRFLV